MYLSAWYPLCSSARLEACIDSFRKNNCTSYLVVSIECYEQNCHLVVCIYLWLALLPSTTEVLVSELSQIFFIWMLSFSWIWINIWIPQTMHAWLSQYQVQEGMVKDNDVLEIIVMIRLMLIQYDKMILRRMIVIRNIKDAWQIF